MLAFQPVARLGVVEGLQGRFPPNQWEVLAVVLRMTARAIFLRGLGIHDRGVVAAMRGESLGDFRVAFQASKLLTAPTQAVAEGALGGSVPSLVHSGERPGRDLRASLGANQQLCPCDCKEHPNATPTTGIGRHQTSATGKVRKPRLS